MMQAEFIACYEATGQAIWLKNFILRLKVANIISIPLVLYCDNESIVFYSTNKSSVAARHINIKYYAVKDKIQNHTIDVKHISTTCMLADPLTKGLPPNIFCELGLLEAL
jgi:hypothetical protein